MGREPKAGQLVSELHSRREESVRGKHRAPRKWETPCLAVSSGSCIGSGSAGDNPYSLLSRVSLVSFPSVCIFLLKRSNLLFHCFSVPKKMLSKNCSFNVNLKFS